MFFQYDPVGIIVCPHCWTEDMFSFIPELEGKPIDLVCGSCGFHYSDIMHYDHDEEFEEL